MGAALSTPDQAIRKVKSFIKRGEAEQALVLCNAVLERFPDNRRVLSQVDHIAREANAGGANSVFLQAEIVKLAAHYHARRFREVIETGRALLRSAPSVALIHNLIGAAHQALEEHAEAAAAYRTALELKPDYAEVHRGLGEVLGKSGDHAGSLAALEAAASLRGMDEELLTWRGNALRGLGCDAEALGAYDEALAMNPNHAVAWSFRALVLEKLGQIDGAVASLNRALEINPDFVAARLNLGRVAKFEPGDDNVTRMEDWWEAQSLQASDRILLGFALGKAYDDLGEVDKAFAILTEANRLQREALGYDIRSHEALFALVRSVFETHLADAANWFRPRQPLSKRPVFIVGMPRSGTTLTEQILASHSAVFGAGEMPTMDGAARAALQRIVSEGRSGVIPALEGIREIYGAEIDRLGSPEPVFTDKMPMNFLWAGFIRAAIPEAILVHTSRDAAAVCFSNWKHNFVADNLGFAFDLEDVARFHRLKDALMAFWQKAMPDAIYEVNYEALTEDQEAQTRALLAHCGLEFEPACLAFHETDRIVRTASARQVRQKMYRGSSEAWRAYERHLGPMLDILSGPLPTF
ncbi:tetratricopeptide repeat-containing sulfotransferase family protein [Jiella marina]|uniref:tetratricopeptide repeat-containing sulfotransferase family protein n=1 Tax=Jiella sp. LLJ827 TaxID=2917712 RepID=UPI00210154AA|nr:tetratricopeptide repeat-containing sulfotransferase family protein [Jiella sp. LLJ827]MCQ0990488.1 sulfotransferase [Jiella sp. LLJ827]